MNLDPPDLRAELERLVRPAAILNLVETAPGDPGSPVASRFGGVPYFEAHRKWPRDVEDRPMTFICQIAPGELGLEWLEGLGLITVFFGAGDGEILARVLTYDATDPARHETRPESAGHSLCDPVAITASPVRMLPSWEGLEELDADIHDLVCAEAQEKRELVWDYYEALAMEVGTAGDLVCEMVAGGYPVWLQGDETPRRGGVAMTQLLQFQSNSRLNLWFPSDGGNGYLFTDPDDLEVCAFVAQGT